MQNEYRVTVEEIWRKLNFNGFEELYEISSRARVRVVPYIFFKGSLQHETKSRILDKDEENYVYMRNGIYEGKYRVKTLFKKTFPNTEYDTVNFKND